MRCGYCDPPGWVKALLTFVEGLPRYMYEPCPTCNPRPFTLVADNELQTPPNPLRE